MMPQPRPRADATDATDDCQHATAGLAVVRGDQPARGPGHSALLTSNQVRKMRERSFRRHQANRHMWRRLKEDRNQHYTDLKCAWWRDPKAMARFKEQPQRCSGDCCGNQRRAYGRYTPTLQELRANQGYRCFPIWRRPVDLQLGQFLQPECREV